MESTLMVEKTAGSEEEIIISEMEALCEEAHSILNNYKSQSPYTIVNKIKLLKIDTGEKLRGFVNIFYEKAISEPDSCATFALMCKELAQMQVSGTEPGDTSATNFRKSIITRCQSEFEKNSENKKLRITKAKEIEKCTDTEKKKDLQVLHEEEERRIRMKSVGNIRFIGELFKVGMLTKKIMHFCINHLLQHRDEENLECLCTLLTKIGKNLEAKDDLKDYIKIMCSIVNDKGPNKISSRVRFMIQDVIDLRSNKWVPRRDNSNPKTMDQIQREAESERLDAQVSTSFNTPMNTPRGKDDRGGDRRRNRNDEAFYRKFCIVLNMITDKNFECCRVRIRELKMEIDTKSRMDGVIKLIFKKAVDEPSFSVAYALMCKELAQMQVSGTEPGDTSAINFRKSIITRCQSEFEKDSENEKLRITKAKEIEECTDTEKKNELQVLYEEEERRIRMKSVGNIRFIVELFKVGMLTKKIMHFCINHLLQHRDEENLECLCTLLTTIVKNLETNDDLRDYIKIMYSIMNDKGPNKISSRVRFMIQDVIIVRISGCLGEAIITLLSTPP